MFTTNFQMIDEILKRTNPPGTSGGLLNTLGGMITGQTDFERNMALSAQEQAYARENAAAANAFTAEREDLAWARNQQAAMEQRAWEEQMSNSQVQRYMADLKAADLNPYMAASGGAGASYSGYTAPNATSASGAKASDLKLPVSKIWANTSDSLKSAISGALSIAMIAHFFA